MNDPPSPRTPRFLPLLLAAILLSGCSGGEEEGAGDSEEEGTSEAGEAMASEVTSEASPIDANEMGLIMVLEYHRVGGDPDFAPEWTISTEDFRSQLEYLHENEYHPINFRDLVEDNIDAPAGKTPVVLTFDDSSRTQFTMVERDGEWIPEPEGAVGVMADFHKENPDSWPMRGTFFVLPKADPPNDLFGQPEMSGEKLNYLVDNGMEVGTHTLYHENLALASPEEVQRQIALSLVEIEKRIPDYEVATLGVPFGEYPADMSLLESGSHEGRDYELKGAVEVTGGAAYPPAHPEFDPYRVPRIQAEPMKEHAQYYFDHFEENPGERFISDGDPDTTTIPEETTMPEETTTGAAAAQY